MQGLLSQFILVTYAVLLHVVLAYGSRVQTDGHQWRKNAIPNQFNPAQKLPPDDKKRQLRLRRPMRQCGQVIGIMTVEEILSVAFEFTDEVLPVNGSASIPSNFNALGKQFLLESTVYNVQATVICSSCQEIMESSDAIDFDFVLDDARDGFLSFCDTDRLGYNSTHSGLLLTPIDPSTNQIVEGMIKGIVMNHNTIASTSKAPSEMFPENITLFQSSFDNRVDFVNSFNQIYNAIQITSSGVIAILPDYLGFGQSYQSPRSYAVKALYQQASITLWIKATDLIPKNSQGCSLLEDKATTYGYGEGGYAAFATALALDRLGVTILSARVGGAPFRLSRQLQWTIAQYDAGLVKDPYQGAILARLASAYSSLNPDLPNSETGQDLLSDPWMSPSNYSRNAISWVSDDLTLDELKELVPTPYVPQIIRGNVVLLMRNATLSGSLSPCNFETVGSTDKICEALLENDLYNDILSSDFPVNLCHSPADTVMTIDNIPASNANANLALSNTFGITATGGHLETGSICSLGTIVHFSVINTEYVANSIEALYDPSTCRSGSSPSPTSTLAGETDNGAPVSKSSGCESIIQLLSATGFILYACPLLMAAGFL